MTSFFFKIFGGHKSFFGTTDTPVLDFWWHLPWVVKPGWIPFCVLSHLCDPHIHLWCNTCWLYRGQHGSWAFSIHVLTEVSASIGGDLGLKPMTVHAAGTTLYTTRPLWPRYGLDSFSFWANESVFLCRTPSNSQLCKVVRCQVYLFFPFFPESCLRPGLYTRGMHHI